MTILDKTSAAAGGMASGGMTDVFGIGRVVDEASEVIHEFDRPIWSWYIYSKRGKKGDYSRMEFHLSKIDFILVLVAVLMLIMVFRHSDEKSTAAYNGMFPLLSSLLGGRLKGGGEEVTVKEAVGSTAMHGVPGSGQDFLARLLGL
jgi:hypothetical protein